MIEDKELRQMFRAESEEHIQRLEQGFLHLEKNGDDETAKEEVWREAHSLKGAARMLGLAEIEMLSHRLEDTLRAATRGELRLDPRWLDDLYTGLDAIRSLVAEAVSGTLATVNVSQVMAALSPDKEKRKEAPSPLPAESAKGPPKASEPTGEDGAQEPEAVLEPHGPKGQRSETGVAHVEYHIETIRVQPRQLDELMTQAGELIVTKTGIDQRLHDVEDLMACWEEYGRGLAVRRRLLAELSEEEQAFSSHFTSRLEQIHGAMYEDSTRLEAVTARLDEGIRRIRMLPLSTLFNLFPRMGRDISRELGKDIELIIEGGETSADKRILEELKDPLMHLIRNSLHHGIESQEERRRLGKPRIGTIHLRGYQTAASVVVEVEDDGGGIDLEKIKRAALHRKFYGEEELVGMTAQQIQSLIFLSGLSTQEMVTDISGRGVGLDVVRANIEALKGRLELDSVWQQSTTLRMVLPLTIATSHVMLVQVAQWLCAIPSGFVVGSRRLTPDALFSVEGRQTALIDEEAISVEPLIDLLELPAPKGEESAAHGPYLYCVVVQADDEQLGLLVDAVVDVQEVVVKPPGALLKRVRNVSGSTILGSGEVCMILNPADLIRAVRRTTMATPPEESVMAQGRRQVVLLAEDSLVTRTQEKRILEGAGYQVVVAVDGVDAYDKLSSHQVDGVVSDILMPNMNGFELTKKIRQDSRYKDLPVILVTTLSSDEDKRQGLAVGANAYITKATFEQTVLLETLKRLI